MNVKGEISKDGNYLTLVVDISEQAIAKASPSGSGKTLLVATTSGFTGFGKVKASLNVTVPNKA